MRDDFAGAVGAGERARLHFSAPDANDFAGIDPVRISHDVRVASEDLRPAKWILEIELRQVPERVALFHHVLDFLRGIGADDEVVGGIDLNGSRRSWASGIGSGRDLRRSVDPRRGENQSGAEDHSRRPRCVC